MTKRPFNKRMIMIWAAGLITIFTMFVIVSATALTDTTSPTILYISPMESVFPANNEQDVATNAIITVMFSEDMDPSTINEDTFSVKQRTTPEFGDYRLQVLEGEVMYNDRKATFISNEKLSPDQQYGNVFTVMMTTGAKDLEGNSLLRNYIWSFTTGDNLFNTGTTTSQTNQSSNGSNNSSVFSTIPPSTQQPPAVVPIVAPITGAQTTASNGFPWGWVIGGLLVLALLALILIPSTKSTSQKDNKTVQAKRARPFGDVYPVANIEGIGPKYSKVLQAMGIKNTQQLWEANTAKIAHATGAPISSVMSWQNMAELASVKDIGPQYAELLERSGVHSVDQLKSYKPEELLNIVNEKQDSLKVNIQGNYPGHATVEHWIDEAHDYKIGESEGGEGENTSWQKT